MTRSGLHCHHVADRKVEMGGVAEKSFAGILELHFHKLVVGHASGHVGQPVVAMQFATGRYLAA